MKILSIMAIILYLGIFSQQTTAPSSDCAAISDKGRCYNSFTSSGINWHDARNMCIAMGGDLATVTSLEENTMLSNIKSGAIECWIGLNDIDVENTFVWADGSESTYRKWWGSRGEPTNYGGNEDCTEILLHQYWNDKPCEYTLGCYFCSTTVSPFGEQISPNTYTPLKDNSLLNRNTTLYCITEIKNTPQVTWSFTDLNGVSTTLSATTNATTGVSTLYVTNDKPGYYSCVVSQNGGNTRTYTTVMLDFIIVAENTDNYQYTVGIDADNIFLFCYSPDNSVRLSDIHWKRQDIIVFYPNPLDLHRLGYLLKYTNTHPMECFDAESGNPIMSIQLYVQGPPTITLYVEHNTTFSLLPPTVNRADIPVLTQNVILSANLVGRWQTPNGSYVDSDYIRIPTLYVSHAGLYKFYVTNWDGVWTLAIQIAILPMETYLQTTLYLTTETTNQTSMLVTWSLSKTNPYNSEGTFSVNFGFGNFEFFVGTTKNHFLGITGLIPNINYTVRVDLQYPYSELVISATTHHLLTLSGDTTTNPDTTTESPTNTEPTNPDTTSISYLMYTIIAVLAIFVIILLLVLLNCALLMCARKRGSRSKVNSRDDQLQSPQIYANEIYDQIDTTHPMAHNNELTLFAESVNVSEAKKNILDLKITIYDNSDVTTHRYANTVF